jgi:hypothetical protein
VRSLARRQRPEWSMKIQAICQAYLSVYVTMTNKVPVCLLSHDDAPHPRRAAEWASWRPAPQIGATSMNTAGAHELGYASVAIIGALFDHLVTSNVISGALSYASVNRPVSG